MKFIENQVNSAIADIRSRLKGKTSPQNIALDAMSKIDAAHDKKITLPPAAADAAADNSAAASAAGRDYPAGNADPNLAVAYSVTGLGTPSQVPKGAAAETVAADITGAGVLKKIIPKSAWSNPFIQAALPALLILLPVITAESSDISAATDAAALKLQLIREIEILQKTLAAKQYLPADIAAMASALCTFLDEKLTEKGVVFDVSLHVQFFQDSWGGEKYFTELDRYLEKPQQHKAVLQYYDLFLSLGLRGKYGIIGQGSIVLNSVRSNLRHILYPELPDNLTYLLNYNIVPARRLIITPLKLFAASLIIILLLYALISFYLHSLSRDLRNQILAWQPPVLATIREAPPLELAEILKEGWLQIKPHPLGWLLLFTSDGAFNVGSAELTREFKSKKNLERLGNALANYPGDLVVIGHTDNTQYRQGTGSNLQLSVDRAKTVERELRTGSSINAYNERQISSEGKGDSEPIASNDTAAGRVKNRRVDILWKIGRKEKDEVMQILNDNNDGGNPMLNSVPR